MSGRPIADVSLELGHSYDPAKAVDELKVEVRREAFYAKAIRDSLTSAGATVSVCAMIADADGPDAQALVTEVCDAAGLTVDYYVGEASFAASLPDLWKHFNPAIPRDAAGVLGTTKHVPVVDPVVADQRWLENGEPGRDHPLPEPLRLPVRRSESETTRVVTGSRGSRMHAVHIDVELWSQQREGGLPGPIVWSLPMLAAWWQLLRLGAPAGINDLPLTPEPQSANPHPFCAYSTITVLPARQLAVEHAVQTILSRVAVPDGWLAPSRSGAPTGPLEHLNRISYVFAGDLPIHS